MSGLGERLELLRSYVAKMETEQAQLAMAVNHELLDIAPRLAEMQRLRAEDRSEVTSLLTLLKARAAKAPRRNDSMETRIADIDLAAFYEGFERRFRGTRESVRDKLRPYLADVRHLRHGETPLLDVGPGRCEWLELLKLEQIPSYGVDVNPRFVDTGRGLGLDVRLEDALVHLSSLPPRSLAAITAFQLVEHLDATVLFDFVSQCSRALCPGGLLIMETPNPLNVRVGSARFWIDPSHVRPIHPEFLQFLCQNRGFDEVEVRFSNPSSEPAFTFDSGAGNNTRELSRLASTINHLLFDAMDYAVIARSPAAVAAVPAAASPVETSATQS